MKLTITKAEKSMPGTEKWVASIEGFEDAAERFTYYPAPGFGFVTIGVSSIPKDRADCKDGDVLKAICQIAGLEITNRTSATSADVANDWHRVASKIAREAAASRGIAWKDAGVFVELPESGRFFTKSPGRTALVAHG